jgi:hypothetical protein
MREGGTVDLPMGRVVRLDCATALTAFATDADTLDCISFGVKEALAFDPVQS